MRERLTTLACALGALLVFAILFVRTGPAGGREVSGPTTLERRGNGLLGAVTWLREEGIHTLSLQQRFVALGTRPDLPTRGNLLVVTLPATTAFRTDEAAALDRWVRAGNTLLILAALSDRPDWARANRDLDGDLQLLSGLEAQAPGDSRQGAAPATGAPGAGGPASLRQRAHAAPGFAGPKRSTLLANRPHPYLDGVQQAIALSDFPPAGWSLQVPRDGFMLALAHEAASRQGVLWARPLGAGTIVVSGFASLFSNRALGLADNARLLANIVGTSLAPGGVVIFDDEHQGLSAAYDPAKFYRDRRLYLTLAIIAAVWLVWVLGAAQLKGSSVRIAAPQEAQLVRDTGLYLARVLRPPAAARRMFDNFLHGLRNTLHAPGRSQDDAELWDWLERHPRLAGTDVAQLRVWYAQACADQKVPLVRLRNLMVRTERLLTA